MALFLPGPAVGQISGRVGGTIFSHNQGGMYMRNGSVPTNPQTPAQMAIRAFQAANATAWKGLTDVGRDAWNSWAASEAAAAALNRLGATNQISGQNAFVRLNNRLAYAGLALITAPPATPAPTAVTGLTVTIESDGVSIAFPSLVTTPTTAGAGNHFQIGMTLPKGAGSTRYQTRELRVINTGVVNAALVEATVEAAWNARYGAPVGGSKIGVAVRSIEAASGVPSPWFDAGLITVAAV